MKKERVEELKNEMNVAKEQKEVILNFIEATENMPPIILDILKHNIRKSEVMIEDCKIRLSVHDIEFKGGLK